MPKLVRQSVTLPASAKSLYSMYVNARTHKAITGSKVVISARAGSAFSAFNGMLRGRMLQAVPGRLIVQAWRSSGWKKSDLDSTLILRFTPKGRSGGIDLIHANVPEHDYRGISEGWNKYYWRPWRRYLAKR
jgi:activator of HSP90 ATPase